MKWQTGRRNTGCAWKRCRSDSYLDYFGRGMCWKHWCKFTEMEDAGQKPKALAMIAMTPEQLKRLNEKSTETPKSQNVEMQKANRKRHRDEATKGRRDD